LELGERDFADDEVIAVEAIQEEARVGAERIGFIEGYQQKRVQHLVDAGILLGGELGAVEAHQDQRAILAEGGQVVLGMGARVEIAAAQGGDERV